MHQLSQGVVAPIRSVDIYDVGTVVEIPAASLDAALHLIQRTPFLHDIVLRNKDYPCLREFIKLCALPRQKMGVHHAAVVPGPPGVRSLVRPLNLHVEHPSAVVCCHHIQLDGALQQILHKYLGSDFHDLQIRHLQDNPQDQLHLLRAVLEHLGHKIVVHQAKIPQLL